MSGSSESWSYSDWCIVGSATLSIGIVVLSLVGAQLAKVEAKVKEDQSKATIAEANARAEEARKIAALANEGQAKANSEAAKANERAAILEKEAAALKAEGQKLAIELETAQRKAEEARTIAVSTGTRLGPRTISQEQVAIFVRYLSTAPKGKILLTPQSQTDEVLNFAKQLNILLSKAGYDVVLVRGLTVLGGRPGLSMLISNPQSPPHHALPLQQGLERIGFLALGYSGAQDNVVDIQIGEKPVE